MFQYSKLKQSIKNQFHLSVFLLLIFSQFSCVNDHESSHGEGISLNIDIRNMEEIQASDYFQKIEYIPLQTSDRSMIYSIDKLLVHNNSIYVLDKNNSEILKFSMEGLFLKKLSSKGTGPGEYSEISSFTINTDNDEIILIDNRQENVLIYNEDIEFVEEFSLQKYSLFCECTDNQLVTYSDNIPLEDMNLHFISLRKKKHKKSFLKIDENLRDFQSRTGGQFSTNYKGELLFKESLSRTIYKIGESAIEDYYYVDFDSYNMPDSYFEKKEDIDNLLYDLNKGDYAAYPTVPFESDKYLFFNYSFNFSQKTVIFNKINSELIHGDIINDIDNFAFLDPVSIKDNVLYSFLDSYRFIDIIEIALQNNLIDQNSNLNSNLNKVYQNISVNNNPIIIKYSFK